MIKKCIYCKMDIDTTKERYIKIGDYDKGKNLSNIWAHKQCFLNVYQGKQGLKTIQGMAANFLKQANEKMGFEPYKPNNMEVKI